MSVSKFRNSNIELLRIYSMFFITFGHLWQYQFADASFIPLWLRGCIGIGKVDCFVFITGYFLVHKTAFSLDRYFKILFQIMFYNMVITTVFACVGIAPWRDVLISANPLLPSKFNAWFTTQMLGLVLIQPFLSRFIKLLSKRQYQVLLLSLYLLTTTLIPGFPLGELYSSPTRLSWFITLFFTGGYMRLYMPSYNGKVVLSMAIILSMIWSYCWLRIPEIKIGNDSLITFIVAILIMMVTLKISIGTVRWINFVAGSTYAVYLIHTNCYLREVLGEMMIYYQDMGYTFNFFVGIFTVFLMFVAFIAIDQIRILIFTWCRVSHFQRWLSDVIIRNLKRFLDKINADRCLS